VSDDLDAAITVSLTECAIGPWIEFDLDGLIRPSSPGSCRC
jgi:hypothetical protein